MQLQATSPRAQGQDDRGWRRSRFRFFLSQNYCLCPAWFRLPMLYLKFKQTNKQTKCFLANLHIFIKNAPPWPWRDTYLALWLFGVSYFLPVMNTHEDSPFPPNFVMVTALLIRVVPINAFHFHNYWGIKCSLEKISCSCVLWACSGQEHKLLKNQWIE